ncbi:hypothetical protein QBC42DRAFT_146945, partial [Cladorrhinum samala]
MGRQPPPPPPHGENPKTTAGGSSGLPRGKYDVFIIPEHSAGAGFLYLPSLKPHMNSFLAGLGCAFVVLTLGFNAAPIMYHALVLLGNTGNASTTLSWLILLVIAFLFGMVFGENKASKKSSEGRGRHGYTDARSEWYTPPPPNPEPAPNQAPPSPPPPPPHFEHETPRDGGGRHQSWQEQPRPQQQANPR